MANYTVYRILYEAVEPVHIGAGGYRLGRVDMTIAREPGTNLPKIPGTSFAGAARSYASMIYGKPWAAGQHKKVPASLKKNCPIIYTFGTTSESGDSGQAGVVSFGDARVLMVPVYSRRGPVWVTTRENLASIDVKVDPVPDEGVHTSLPADPGPNQPSMPLNLGYLAFSDVRWGATIDFGQQLGQLDRLAAGRIAVVAADHFSHIVNSNLEVRTSVSINPETGAAEDGALFTYEAIPRGAVLVSDLVIDDYRRLAGAKFPVTTRKFVGQLKVKEGSQDRKEELVGDDNHGEEIGPWNGPADVALAGLSTLEYLGVGGMGTRGFGRLKILSKKETHG